MDCGGPVCPACPVAVCIGSAAGDPGQTVTVPVTLDSGAGVAGFQVDLIYDGGLLDTATPRLGAATFAAGGWSISGAPIGPGQFRVLGYSDPPAGLPPASREVALVDFGVSGTAPIGATSGFTLANCVLSDALGVQIPCGSCPQPGHVTIRPASSLAFVPIDSPVGVDKFDPQPFVVTVDALTFSSAPATSYNGSASMSVGPACGGSLQPATLPFASGVGTASFTIACCVDPLFPMTRTSLSLGAVDSTIGISGNSGPFDGVAKGDVNADNAINVLDVIPAVNLSLGLPVNLPPLAPPVPFQRWAANMLDQRCSVDGFINVLDIVRIRNKALGRPALCACTSGATGGPAGQAAALAKQVPPISVGIVRHGPRDFLVQVHGVIDLSGLQIELKGAGPRSKVSLEGQPAAQRWQANTVLDKGVLRIVTFSNAAVGISGDGTVLRISGGGNLRITSIVASDSAGREIPVK